MEPLFRTGRDMVVIKRAEGEMKKYDVVLYRGAGGEYILHRIIKVRDDLYIIRGDNTYSKEYVPKDAVIGVLTSFNRKGKSGSPASFSFKLYSRLWNFIYPLRYMVYAESAEEMTAEILFSTPKKFLKRANKRNKVRRRMREAYRLNKALLLDSAEPRHLQVAIIYSSKEVLDYKTIENATKRILEKLG